MEPQKNFCPPGQMTGVWSGGGGGAVPASIFLCNVVLLIHNQDVKLL